MFEFISLPAFLVAERLLATPATPRPRLAHAYTHPLTRKIACCTSHVFLALCAYLLASEHSCMLTPKHQRSVTHKYEYHLLTHTSQPR